MNFSWDAEKNNENIRKHKISFYDAQYAFGDAHRIIMHDTDHSSIEDRYFCIGKIDSGIVTVRFTMRESVIRIIGAGFWRKGRKLYEQQY